jgi:hypothetical protein
MVEKEKYTCTPYANSPENSHKEAFVMPRESAKSGDKKTDKVGKVRSGHGASRRVKANVVWWGYAARPPATDEEFRRAIERLERAMEGHPLNDRGFGEEFGEWIESVLGA